MIDNNIPKPSDILGKSSIPSPSDILGGPLKKKVQSGIESPTSFQPSNIGGMTDQGGIPSPLIGKAAKEYKPSKTIQNIQKIGELNKAEPKPNNLGIFDTVSEYLYLPSLNQGFSDLVIKPMAGATDFIDRTIDKAYNTVTGEKTPEWLRKGGGFDTAFKFYNDQFENRIKPTNLVSEVAEGVVGTVPLIASLAMGTGEANVLAKTPQVISKLTKLFAVKGALNSYKDATDEKLGYIESLGKSSEGFTTGIKEGLKLEATMMVGGALGKGVAQKLLDRGLLIGGKSAEAILHALSIGTVFAGTSAGDNLLNGEDIDVREAAKQFGMGLAFELIPTAKQIGKDLSDVKNSNKISNAAVKSAALAKSASNLNSESAIRNLLQLTPEQIKTIHDNVKETKDDLYASSIESGAKAYEETNPEKKRDLYINQLGLKAQGDVKLVSEKLNENYNEVKDVIENSTELSPEDKVNLLEKLNILGPKDLTEANVNGDLMPSEVQGVVTEKQREIESLSNQLQDENVSEDNKKVISDRIKTLEDEVNLIIDNANKQQENAVQEPSTSSQVSPVGEAGQVITEGGEGVGQSIEGEEATKEVNPQEIKEEEVKLIGNGVGNGENAIVKFQENNPEVTDLPLNTIEENLNIGDTVNGNIYGENVSGKVINVGIHRGQIVVDIVDQNGNNRFLYSKNIDGIEPKQREIERLTPEQNKRSLELRNKEELTSDELSELGELGKIKRGEIPNPQKELPSKENIKSQELINAEAKLKKAKSEASKKRLLEEIEKLSTPEQFDKFVKENQELSKNLPKAEEVSKTEPIEDLEIEGEAESPTETKRKEIEKRRQDLLNKIRNKGAQASSGFNPDIIPDLIKLGITYIEDGVLTFKEFAERLKNDYGFEIPEENARDIFKKSAESLGKGIRKLPERIAADEGLSSELRDIANEADTVYQKQNYDEIQDTLDNMSEVDKNAIVGTLENATGELGKEGNIGVLAAIDLINKYEAAGDTAGAKRIFDIVSKSSTVFAQLLRQYGELKSSTVQGFVSLIEKQMLNKYKVKLTDAQRTEISDLYNNFKQKTDQFNEALKNHINDLTSASKKKLGKANIELEDAVRLLNDYTDSLKPKTYKGLVDKMISTIQGNLLSLKSLVVNPFANAIQYGYKFSSNEVANLLDLAISIIPSQKRTRISGFNLDAMRLSGKASFEGLKKANRMLLKGAASSELNKYDVSGRLKPVEAWKSLFRTLSGKEKATIPGVLTDLVEAFPGTTANLALRLLPYGDLPRNEMAKAYKLVEIGITKFNLKGNDLDRFLLDPDAESLKIAQEYGDKATLQNKTVFYNKFNEIISSLDAEADSKAAGALKGLSKLIVRGVIVPFVKTPINFAVIAFRYSNPAIPLGQAAIEMLKITEYGKIKNADLKAKKIAESRYKATGYLGEAIVAQAVLATAMILIKNGLITPGIPKKDEKGKNFMYETFGPNQINISGLKRLLDGGDPKMKSGDVSISYAPMGLLGAQLGVASETYRYKESEAEKQSKIKTTGGKPFYDNIWDASTASFSGILSNMPASVNYMLDQGFVQGTSSLLEAVKNSDYSGWASQWTKTLFTGLAIPNTAAQSFKAANDFMTNTFSEDDIKRISNTVKNVYGDTEDLPIRYNMWGEPIPQTPKGSNPYVFNVVDIFRTQKLLQDKYTYNVYLLYKKTDNTKAIPSGISDILDESKGEFKVKLNEEEKSQLQKLVGEERLKSIKNREPFDVNNDDPKYLNRTVKGYQISYAMGLARGKRRFKLEVLNKKQK